MFLIGAVISVVVAAAPSPQEYAVRYEAGRVTVRASGVPLGRVLGDLAVAASFQRLLIDPSVEQRSLTIHLTGETPRDAVIKIVDQAQVAYVLWGATDPRGFRLVAGAPDFIPRAIEQASREPEESPTEVTAAEPVPLPSPDDDEAARATADKMKTLRATLAPVPRPATGSLALPFPGPDGQPIRQAIGPPRSTVPLPFPGPDGKPLQYDLRPGAPKPPLPEDPKVRQIRDAFVGATPRPAPIQPGGAQQ